MNRLLLIVIFFSTILISCSKKNPKDIQNEVFEDIFSELIENSTQDFRKMVTPTPELIKLWKEGKDLPKKKTDDKRKMLIVINDSIRMPRIPNNKKHDVQAYDLETLIEFNFKNFNYNKGSTYLISNSEYNENFAKLLNEFYFGGLLDISEITFKDNMKEAHLFVNYRHNKLYSQKVKIYLKKENANWSIIKSELINLS